MNGIKAHFSWAVHSIEGSRRDEREPPLLFEADLSSCFAGIGRDCSIKVFDRSQCIGCHYPCWTPVVGHGIAQWGVRGLIGCCDLPNTKPS